MQIGDWVLFSKLLKIKESDDCIEVTIEFRAINNELGIGTYHINTIISPKDIYDKVIQPLEMH